MLACEKNKFYFEFVRGDTEKIKLNFTRNGEAYIPKDLEDGDRFTLTLCDRFTDNVVLTKVIEYPDTIFVFQHDDTDRIGCGTYAADIEYSKLDRSVVKTFKGSIKITKDYTR